MSKLGQPPTWKVLLGVMIVVAAVSASLIINSIVRTRGPFWESYQRVAPGMAREEVFDLIGKLPNSSTGNLHFDMVDWSEGNQSLMVKFEFDPRTSKWLVTDKRFSSESWWETLKHGLLGS
jgi:hypothetical protein